MEGILFSDYAWSWFSGLALRPGSIRRYESILRLHLIPELGNLRLEQIDQKTIRLLYATKSKTLSASSTHSIARVLGAILQSAVDEEVLEVNRASVVSRKMKLRRRVRAELFSRVRAFTRGELERNDERLLRPMAPCSATGGVRAVLRHRSEKD